MAVQSSALWYNIISLSSQISEVAMEFRHYVNDRGGCEVYFEGITLIFHLQKGKAIVIVRQKDDGGRLPKIHDSVFWAAQKLAEEALTGCTARELPAAVLRAKYADDVLALSKMGRSGNRSQAIKREAERRAYLATLDQQFAEIDETMAIEHQKQYHVDAWAHAKATEVGWRD